MPSRTHAAAHPNLRARWCLALLTIQRARAKPNQGCFLPAPGCSNSFPARFPVPGRRSKRANGPPGSLKPRVPLATSARPAESNRHCSAEVQHLLTAAWPSRGSVPLSRTSLLPFQTPEATGFPGTCRVQPRSAGDLPAGAGGHKALGEDAMKDRPRKGKARNRHLQSIVLLPAGRKPC